MIYLVHGDNPAYSRNIILNQQKKLGVEHKQEYLASETSTARLHELLNSFDIFGTPPFVLIKVDSAKMNWEEYEAILKKCPAETVLILYAEKELPKSNYLIKNAATLNIKVVLNQKVQTHNIFKFVDAVFSKNTRTAYAELKKLMEADEDNFYIFSMLLWGARKNYNKYSQEKLGDLFKFLYEVDLKAKTGGISQELMIPYSIEKIAHDLF